MELKIIKNKKQYEAYLDLVDSMFDKKVKRSTPEGDKLELALLLIKQYENSHFQIPIPDPIDAIRIKMNERGLKNKDLVGKYGSKGYIYISSLKQEKAFNIRTCKNVSSGT